MPRGTVEELGQALTLIQMGAPLHPIMVHFTIALTAASLAFDVLGYLSGITSLSAAGWWTLAGSVLMTIFTIATGITSRLRLHMEEGEARSFLRTHMALGPIFFGLLVGVFIWRAVLWETRDGVDWWYLSALAGTALVMTTQGFIGGELVYRYGTEVKGDHHRLPVLSASSPIPAIASQEVSKQVRRNKNGGPP